jgi:hypothetical protein
VCRRVLCSHHLVSSAFDWSPSCLHPCYSSRYIQSREPSRLVIAILALLGVCPMHLLLESSSPDLETSSIISHSAHLLSVRYRSLSVVQTCYYYVLATCYPQTKACYQSRNIPPTSSSPYLTHVPPEYLHRPLISKHHPLSFSPSAMHPVRYRRPLSLKPAIPTPNLLLLLKNCYYYILLLLYSPPVIHETLSTKHCPRNDNTPSAPLIPCGAHCASARRPSVSTLYHESTQLRVRACDPACAGTQAPCGCSRVCANAKRLCGRCRGRTECML